MIKLSVALTLVCLCQIHALEASTPVFELDESCFDIGQGYKGKDIKHVADSATPGDCQNKCQNTEGCIVWTHDTRHRHINTPASYKHKGCWLHHGKGPRWSSPDAVSGDKYCPGQGADNKVCVVATTGNITTGTSDANIHITLKDKEDRIAEHMLKLKNTYQNVSDCIQSSDSAYSHFTTISVSRDDDSADASWFSELIKVDNKAGEFYFPINRWVPAKRNLTLVEYDCTLPVDEIYKQQRSEELARNRELYKYSQNGVTNGPVKVQNLPIAEMFTPQMIKSKNKFRKNCQGEAMRVLVTLMKTRNQWKSLKDMEQQFTVSKFLPRPPTIETWKTDKWFGLQRVLGLQNNLITLCKQIPHHKFPVTDDMVSASLEGDGYTLSEALDNSKIFIIDLSIMEGIRHRVIDGELQKLTEPIALFYLNKTNDLMPIAIQLHQKPANDNPIFLPSDDEWTWTLAKMWYNNAESNYHIFVNHYGTMHMVMEAVCIAMHRNLSPSHPLFRLLSPHFLGLLSINKLSDALILARGSYFDKYMIGSETIIDLIIKGLDEFTIDGYGDVENNMELRGVLDKDILPYYPYRDDMMPYYTVIKKYASKIVNHYYADESVLRSDDEFVNFYKELTAPRGAGMGLKWKQGNKPVEGLTKQDVVTLLTMVITTGSVEHGISNYPLYTQMSWSPNYPEVLVGSPPTDKRRRTEGDIVASLPNMKDTMVGLAVKKLITEQGNLNPLGDFEVQYLYRGLDVAAVEEFKEDLRKVSKEVKEANDNRKFKYSYLTSVTNTRNSITT